MTIANFGENVKIDPGAITMWAGLLSEVPSGWAICDGNNGTPDLTGRFLRSIPDSTTSPGQTGGTSTVTMSDSQMPNHSHTGSTDNSGSHKHSWDRTGGDTGEEIGSGVLETSGSPDIRTSYDAPHSHSVSLNSEGATSPSSIDNRPNYYELAFIQKL